jgi:hypothetical protein
MKWSDTLACVMRLENNNNSHGQLGTTKCDFISKIDPIIILLDMQIPIKDENIWMIVAFRYTIVIQVAVTKKPISLILLPTYMDILDSQRRTNSHLTMTISKYLVIFLSRQVVLNHLMTNIH